MIFSIGSTVKALYFMWDLFCEIECHANIFGPQTLWQYIITMLNVTISVTVLFVTWIIALALNGRCVKSMCPKCSTSIAV